MDGFCRFAALRFFLASNANARRSMEAIMASKRFIPIVDPGIPTNLSLDAVRISLSVSQPESEPLPTNSMSLGVGLSSADTSEIVSRSSTALLEDLKGASATLDCDVAGSDADVGGGDGASIARVEDGGVLEEVAFWGFGGSVFGGSVCLIVRGVAFFCGACVASVTFRGVAFFGGTGCSGGPGVGVSMTLLAVLVFSAFVVRALVLLPGATGAS